MIYLLLDYELIFEINLDKKETRTLFLPRTKVSRSCKRLWRNSHRTPTPAIAKVQVLKFRILQDPKWFLFVGSVKRPGSERSVNGTFHAIQ